jgi:hypothetical protein
MAQTYLQNSALGALNLSEHGEVWVKSVLIHRLTGPIHPDLPLAPSIQAPIH